MIKKILIVIAIFITSVNFAQSRLNDYKYVIVPIKYDFLNEADKYQLNSLSEFLFNKYKFNAYLENKTLPEDLKSNRCLALQAGIIESKSMFKTKVKVQLKNCNGQVIYTTPEGESRRKEYKSAYTEALRNAFNHFATINYKYNNSNTLGNNNLEIPTEKTISEIEQLKKEIKQLKENKEEKVEVNKDLKTIKEPVNNTLDSKEHTLYAQKINNGFQLVDKTPKLVYTIYNSGKKDVYIVKGQDAIIYKLNSNWVISQFINNNLEVKAIDIKF